MDYITVIEASRKWGVTERMVRNYCMNGLIPDACQNNNAWLIPETAEKPRRKAREKSEAARPALAKNSGISRRSGTITGCTITPF